MPPLRRFIPAPCLLAIGLLMISQASARLYISEFVADNNDGLRDLDASKQSSGQFVEKLSAWLMVKVRTALGPKKSDDRSLRLLNPIIAW